jgi:hypothetical protein
MATKASVARRHAGHFMSLWQLVVFALKSFVQDLVGSRFERLDPAIIAGANQDRDPAVNVSFVAPLPKCHFFHAFGNTPFFANFTNDGLVFGGHRPIPSPSP